MIERGVVIARTRIKDYHANDGDATHHVECEYSVHFLVFLITVAHWSGICFSLPEVAKALQTGISDKKRKSREHDYCPQAAVSSSRLPKYVSSMLSCEQQVYLFLRYLVSPLAMMRGFHLATNSRAMATPSP